MARTFSYQKNHRNNQQPPLRSSWRSSTQATIKRGKYAELADRVREYRLDMLNHQKDQANEVSERQKRPVSD